MAIWETPDILSGPSTIAGQAVGAAKPELGVCILHTGLVTMDWAMRFRVMQFPNYIYTLGANQPYDTAREMTTRTCLEHGVKWVFHFDSDVIAPANTVPLMIEWAEKFDKPVLSGLYWAKKPGPPMPAAWVKVGEKPEENRIEFAPVDIKPHLGKNAILQCDVVGAGCLLVKADVFKKLDESDPKKPYWKWGLGRKDINGKNLPQMSEDFYFCQRCVDELGIHPHVCTAITCDHITSVRKKGENGEYELLGVRV